MVISKNGKRKRKEAAPAVVTTPAVSEAAPITPTTPEVPKRIKVHAQRKFAQGQGCSTSYASTAQTQQSTPNKDASTRNEVPTEILPNQCPKTEDFIKYLCFRGTSILPSHLDYFNTNNTARAAAAAAEKDKAPAPKPAVGPAETAIVSSSTDSCKPLQVPPEQVDSTTSSTVETASKSDKTDVEKSAEHFIPFAVRKQAETVSDGKRRQAVQALKKKYQEQRIAKTQVQNLNRSSQKNRVTRSGGTIDETDMSKTTESNAGADHSTDTPSTRKISLRNKTSTPTVTDASESLNEAPLIVQNVSKINRSKSASRSVADSCEQESVKTSETMSKKARSKKKEVNHMPTRLTRQHASAYPESYRLAEEAELKSIQMSVKDMDKSNNPHVEKSLNESGDFSSDDDRPLVKSVSVCSTNQNKPPKSSDTPLARQPSPVAPTIPEQGIFEASPEPIKIEELPKLEDTLSMKKKIHPVKKSKVKRRTTSVEQSDELKIIIKTTAESVDSASMASNEAPVSKKMCPSSTAKSSVVNDVGSVASDDTLAANKQTKRNLPASSKSVVLDDSEPGKTEASLAVKKKRRNEFTDLVQNENHAAEAEPIASSTRVTRPSRKTKEAAAIYMELIGQKLNFDDFDEDNASMDSFPELPNVRKTQQMENELKANVDKERTLSQDSIKTSTTPKKTKSSNQGVKVDSDDADSTQKERQGGSTAKRKLERKSLAKTNNASIDGKDTQGALEKSFSESDEEPLAIKLTKKDDQSSVPEVISVSSKTDENIKEMVPSEPLFPPPLTPHRRHDEPRTPTLKSPPHAYIPEHHKLPSPSHMLPKYEPPRPHLGHPNPSPPLGYPRTPSYQPSPFKTPGDHSAMLSPSINISPMVSSKEDSRTLKSPPPQSPSHPTAIRSPPKNSTPGAPGMHSPGGTSTQSVSAILANLMPSKEESGKIFGIASVTLAQSSGPNDTKCTLGKCGSVHKPPLGPVVPTETIILNDQMTSKERRKAKVNMTHDQIQKWLADCLVNQEMIDDLSSLDLTSPLIPINYKVESSPPRDASDVQSSPSVAASGTSCNKLIKAAPTRSPIRNPAKDSPQRNTPSSTTSKQGPISKAKAAQIQTVTKDDYVAYNKMFDERNTKDSKSRLNTPITVSPCTIELVSNVTPDNGSGKSAEDYKLKANEKPTQLQLETANTKSCDSSTPKAKVSTKLTPTTAISTEKLSPVKLPTSQQISSPISSKTPTAATAYPQTPTSSSPIERKTPIYNPKRTPVYNTKPSDIPNKSKAIVNTFGAFSPENEASIYSFDKDDDFSAFSTPFARNRGNETSSVKSEKSNPSKTKKSEARVTSTSTSVTPTSKKPIKQEISLTLSPDENSKSASIAVEVNMDLSTLPKPKPAEGNDTDADAHTFYIPLQGTNITGNKSDQLIQGVAVKLGTEGPDGPNQRVIMHAKLVTKAQMGSNTTPIPESLGNVQEIVKSLMANKEAAKLVPVGTVQPRFKSSDNLNESASSQQPSTSGLSQHNSNNPLQSQKVRQPPKQPRSKNEASIQPSNNTAFPRHDDPAQMVEAPVFRPTEKEFADPMEFFDRISPIAARFGLCRVIPPASFKPECKISDDMRFTSYNQYVHKMLHRWGPSAKEFSAIKKYLATQSVQLIHPPYIGGMEVDLPRLYHTVQELGGLRDVIEKKKWARVAEEMCFPKTAQDRVSKLDDIYCKYLLPYDTLSPTERQKLFDEVEADWAKTEAKARRNADRTNLSDVQSNEDDDEDEESENDEEEEDGGSLECIVEGRKMPLKQFFRIARNTMSLWFKNTEPTSSEIEAEYWRHVAVRDSHVCVHSGSIDSSGWGYGFPTPGPKAKGSTCGKNPWNLKVLTNNNGSILRSIGPVTGVTVPTLHVGMLFSACCWYRDPHGLPWIEYLHTGGSKIWYGVPDEQSANFRSAFTSLVPTHCQNKTVWLPCDTAMVPPHMLTDRGVSLCRAEQEPGQFVIVFPRAYTSSLGTGYTISESVYFATNNWLDTAKGDFMDIHDSCEPAMFSLEQLLFAVAQDTRSNCETLEMVLPMMNEVYEREVTERNLIQLAGVSNTEKVPVKGSKKTATTSLATSPGNQASAADEDPECDSCRANVYLSWIRTEQDAVYCLQHGLKHINSGRLVADQCRLVFTYSIENVEQLIARIRSRTTGSPPTAAQSMTVDNPSVEQTSKTKKTNKSTNKRK